VRLSEGDGILGLLVRLRTMRRQATDRSRMLGIEDLMKYSGRR
jgi:hypothetical protein